MDDKNMSNRIANLVLQIAFSCKQFADEQGFDFGFVVRTVANAMLNSIEEK